MVQSPSWEANWFVPSQEIPRISRNPMVHYRTDKRPSPVPILGQPYPVHIPTSHLLEIHLNIIHPSTPTSPQWSPSLRFPHQDPIHPLSSPIRATCPAHLILRHYCIQKRPPPVSILGQTYPIHIPTSHLLEIRPNIIHPSTPMSPEWSLSFRFPHQDAHTVIK